MNSINLLYVAAAVTRRLESGIGSSMSDAPRSENLLLGLRVTILGMGMCFVVLMLLWGVLELFRVFLYRKNSDKNVDEGEKDIVVPDFPAIESRSDTGDELIAVITAAAAAYLSAEAELKAASGEPVPDTRFRVVSFRKKA
ncbi:MAG TPA: OadG family protein [Clostridiales bacterium]|jgi:sodium pump decarboxylase gamma subunit|nr:OadG family protein [Clostridiales bacterium]